MHRLDQAGTHAVRIESRLGHCAWSGTGSTFLLPNIGEQAVDEITGLALSEHPRLKQFSLRPFANSNLATETGPSLR